MLLGLPIKPEQLRKSLPFFPVHTISAVVPALNEEKHIRNCISSLLQQPEIIEVIVADGGSADGTVKISEASRARVVRCDQPGRGIQIREGIQHSHGDVILVVHADCRLMEGAAGEIIYSLNRELLLAGGAFCMAFASPDIRQRIISGLNNLRAKTSGISFGDQGQFVRNEALDRIGGFPDQMLMEDVELSIRLRRAGRLVFLPKGIIASGRRWESQPFARGVARVLHLFLRYLIERRNGKISEKAKDYHTRYYGK
jgi:rSAM/selenodomain-associated transferase 2